MVDQSTVEMAAFFDFINTYSGGAGLLDISIKDLLTYLKSPLKYRRQLIKLSKYYYNKDGIVTDVYDLFNVLPVLNYSTLWQNMDTRAFKKNKQIVDNFLKSVKVKKLVRDTIFSVIQEGTCVWYNRGDRYVQFLENEEYMIDYMVNGKWQVFYDLLYIEKYKSQHMINSIQAKIEAAPDEVTMRDYLNYQKDKTKYRYIPLDINKTQVFKLRGSRNEPYGVPFCVPAISSIIHKDLLERTEKALADRIINQIIIQKVGNMPNPNGDGKSFMPVPKPTIDLYHTNLKNLIQKKYQSGGADNASIAPLTVPAFIEIEELKVEMSAFPKEIWERVNNDIFRKLGFSQALNSGGGNGQSFGSSTINVEKINSIIFYLLEDIEEALNQYFDLLVLGDNLNPQIKFSRSSILDKETTFKQAEALYLKGRGSLKLLVEAAGYDWEHYFAQTRYENEVLKLDEILPVHSTSFTQSGDGTGGNPGDKGTKNDNTNKSNGNGGNATPSPSD